MSKRMTAERLAEIELRAETLELDTRTWSDRDELLQALKAERSYADLCDDQEADNRRHIEELEGAILKNCDITVQPWCNLFNPYKALQEQKDEQTGK